MTAGIDLIPSGYWYDLVLISQVKALLKSEMPLDLREEFLKYLTTRSGPVTDEVVTAVEPACAVASAMIEEMNSLSIDDKCRIMRKPEVFGAYVTLNPSLLVALKMCSDVPQSEYRRVTK